MPGPAARSAPAVAGRLVRAAAGALLPLLLAAALAALAGCEAATKVDCDYLLGQRKYQQVLDNCNNPYHRASAYLGLAGFQFTNLLNSSVQPGEVVSVLGLTPGNIDQRRQYLEHAVEAVNPPHGGTQAFAELLSTLLGLDTATEEELDANLDGTISQAEINAALQPTYQVPVFVPLVPPQLQVTAVVGGKPYILVCTSADTPNACGPAPATTQVYDDPDGSGRLTPAIIGGGPSGNAAAVLAAIASATSVGMIVQISNLSPPATFPAAQTQFLPGYLGAGQPQGPYTIGLGGYLQAMSTASAALLAAGGQPGGSTVTSYVNALVSKFDNGAACSFPAPLNTFGAALVGYLNAFAPIYPAAAGTIARPFPANAPPTYFSTQNLASTSIRTGINAVNVVPFQLPDPGQGGTITYAFTGGAITQYKFLYPTAPGLPAFDATQATPRVDQAYAGFVSQFEAIPIFAPSIAGDGVLTFLELLCAGT